jgi:hypothetical protein
MWGELAVFTGKGFIFIFTHICSPYLGPQCVALAQHLGLLPSGPGFVAVLDRCCQIVTYLGINIKNDIE